MRILFATDGSRGAAVAEDFLLALPLSCADEITVVTVPIGSEVEACTSATMSGDGAIESIIQEALTDWMRLPKLDNRLAIQMLRKTG